MLTGVPLLSIVIWLPIVGAILLLLIGNRDGSRDGLVRNIALGASLATFAATLVLWAGFDMSSGAEFQFLERVPWIPAFGIDYSLGIDGISLMLIVLTGFLTPIAFLSSWESIHMKVKEFSIFMLLLETSMLGVFASLDLFLFYVFWDFVLIPMYFIIGIWGYERRIYAAVKFILYTMAGSVLMLIAIIGLAWIHQTATGSYSFDLQRLYGLQIPERTQFWFFLAFAVAFAIKVPLFPFHTWLPDAHVEAPTPGSVILAGVMLKLGSYGLVRFAFPLFPEAARVFRAVAGDAGGHRDCLWRAGGDGAARHEETGGVFVGEPHGLRRAWHRRHEHAGRAGRGLPDAGARREHRRPVLHRRDALGSPAHAVDQRVRRDQADRAETDRGVAADHAGLNRVAWHERFHRRVPHPARRVPLGSALCRGGRTRA